ncbi:MAG: Sec-independent protein translocase protein TatB [Blastocatellia bacterium]
MFLFIFESIGTSELILIGIIALIFLGPRKLPEMARKIGKMMADFRNTTNEFKSTWEREVDFEEETKALRLEEIEKEAELPAAIENSILGPDKENEIAVPEIKSISPAEFEKVQIETSEPVAEPEEDLPNQASDKRTWL